MSESVVDPGYEHAGMTNCSHGGRRGNEGCYTYATTVITPDIPSPPGPPPGSQ